MGYRRWGHNEGDEPAYTQPLMYAEDQGPPVGGARSTGSSCVRTGGLAREALESLWAEKKAADAARGARRAAFAPIARRAPEPRPPSMRRPCGAGSGPTLLGLDDSCPRASSCTRSWSRCCARGRAARGQRQVDWATAEALAFGTLLLEGISVRLSGQDSGRGTFSQRHAVLYDARTRHASTCPCRRLAHGSARFEVHDSLLSEAAVLGFEFGYTVAEHDALVMWEAQFGDFANGAQVIIDQFLAGSEQKWGQPIDLVLLLPHGHEGQGPEHSQRPPRALPDPVRRAQPAGLPPVDARLSTSTCCGARRATRSRSRWSS